jgi:peptidoglycan/xylan/chitin deacetylase (PgdA/CDA1 family)
VRPAFRTAARVLGLRRNDLLAARVRYERTLIPTVHRRPRIVKGRVLCYHSVGTPEWGINDVPPKLFRSQLEMAVGLGYRFVPAEKIAAGLCEDQDLALTFDDGLKSVLENAAPILAGFGIPWNLFVVCDWADGKHDRPQLFMRWHEIRELAKIGVAIGSHSVTHPDFGQLSDDEARVELWDSRRVIRDRTGIGVDSFAIPFGQSRNWRPVLSKVAESLGYRAIFAQAADTRVEGTVPRTFVTRFDGARIFKAALEGAFDRWEEPA